MPITPNSARSLIEWFYETSIRLRPQETSYTIGTTSQVIGKYANQRSAVLVSNSSGNTVYLGFSSGVSSTSGIVLNAGQWFSFGWYLDNELCSQDLWAVASAGSTTIYVLESVLAPVVDG